MGLSWAATLYDVATTWLHIGGLWGKQTFVMNEQSTLQWTRSNVVDRKTSILTYFGSNTKAEILSNLQKVMWKQQ